MSIWLEQNDKVLDSLGITLKNLFPAVYYALGLGAFFVMEAMIVNFLKYGGQFNLGANIGALPLLPALGLSFATAVSEEITFRGYIFTRVWSFVKDEMWANLLTSLFWAMIHVPVMIFVWKLDLSASSHLPLIDHALWHRKRFCICQNKKYCFTNSYFMYSGNGQLFYLDNLQRVIKSTTITITDGIN